MLLVAASVFMAEAYPRYVAVPIEDMRAYPSYYPQESRVRPVARQVAVAESRVRPVVRPLEEARPVIIIEEEEPEQWELAEASSDRYEHQAGGYGGGNDHVDYGAYTGGYGAFGWYSDHPVCVNCGYHH